jgi:hypothetical protein
MVVIPPAKDSDAEDVAWGLQTAEALWKRGERIDAIVWLRRAAQAAGDAADDDRALELARSAAELSDWMATQPSVTTSPPGVDRHNTSTFVPDGGPMSIEVDLEDNELARGELPAFAMPSGSVRPAPPVGRAPSSPTMQTAEPYFPEVEKARYDDAHAAPNDERNEAPHDEPEVPATTSVPPAEHVHAGMFNPWDEQRRSSNPPEPVPPPPPPDRFRDDEEVMTSVRPQQLAAQRADSLAAALARAHPQSGAPPPPPVLMTPVPPQDPVPSDLESAPATPPPANVRIPPPRPSGGRPPPLPPRARKPPVPPVPTAPSTPTEGMAKLPQHYLAQHQAGTRDSEPDSEREPPRELPRDEQTEEAPPVHETMSAEAAPVNVPVPAPVPEEEEREREEEREPGRAPASDPTLAVAAPVGVVPETLDLEDVEAFADLPDDARVAFAAAAQMSALGEGEEVSGFALAYILAGAVDVAATMVDAPAARLVAGAVLRSRGTMEEGVPMRLIGVGSGVVATWTDAAVADAFRTCPWVEEDLRTAADRLQTLVGVTIGPLGERLDASIREQIIERLTMRTLIAGEIIVNAGEAVPGLLLIGVGELELVDGDKVVGVVGSGEFLFPGEVLGAGAVPHTARAGTGGALILFGDRMIAQELLVTCPPLLEVFAGM